MGKLLDYNGYNNRKDIENDFSQDNLDFEQIYRDIVKGTDNGDRSDAAVATLLGMQQREEDYQRSLPLEQVNQLMRAGMSRAAALQLLQGGGSSEQSTATIAGNVEESSIARAQAATQGIAQLGGLALQGVQAGFSISAMMPQMQMQKQMAAIYPDYLQSQQAQWALQKSISQSTSNGYNMAGFMQQALQNYCDATGTEYPSSMSDAISLMKDVPRNDVVGEQLGNFYDTYGQDILKDPIVYGMCANAIDGNYFSRWYNSWNRKQSEASYYLQQVDAAKVNAEIALAGQELINSIKQGRLTDEQIKQVAASIGLTNAQITGQELVNELQAYQNNFSYFDLRYKTDVLLSLPSNAAQQAASTMFQEQQSKGYMAYLNTLCALRGTDLLNGVQMPNAVSAWAGFHALGVDALVPQAGFDIKVANATSPQTAGYVRPGYKPGDKVVQGEVSRPVRSQHNVSMDTTPANPQQSYTPFVDAYLRSAGK